MKTRMCRASTNDLFDFRHLPLAATRCCACLCLVLGAFAYRSRAQVFPPQGDDTTISLGVFRVVVDPLYRPLLSPTGSPTFFSGYPGFHTLDGRLTSPALYDPATTIGRSSSHPHNTPYFPAPIGVGSWDSVSGYSAYPYIPSLWSVPPGAPNGTDEVLTEIKSFQLKTFGGSGANCPDPNVPTVPAGIVMVRAGTFAGVSPRSLGMVQPDTPLGPPDFPAKSFFDIFVDVTLPPLPGTESSLAFPATGAVLTNGVPLIVTNLDLTSFPPSVVYIHGGNTNAVPMYFKFSNPPYWAAGDLFGKLVLAGHGTFTNDCSHEQALTTQVLGSGVPEYPIPWLRTNDLAPSAGSGYASQMAETNPPTSMDLLTFGKPTGGAIYLRNIDVYNLINPITPPYFGTNPVPWSNSVVQLACQVSMDSNNWFQATGGGPVAALMFPPAPCFPLRLTELNLSFGSQLGSMAVRLDPGNPSTGSHCIEMDSRGFSISSFFDVFVDLSTDGGSTWIPADRSIRVQATSPAPAPGTLFVHPPDVAHGTNGPLKMSWLGPFTLQSTPKISGPYTDVTPNPGGSLANTNPVTIGPAAQFYRLRQ